LGKCEQAWSRVDSNGRRIRSVITLIEEREALGWSKKGGPLGLLGNDGVVREMLKHSTDELIA
jgi:hypothetical protein